VFEIPPFHAMHVRVLGAHNLESSHTRCTSLLVNKVLAIDAGSLTSGLTFEEQTSLEALVLTHRHMDHVRDLPGIGLALRLREASLPVYLTGQTADAVREHLLNGILYPRLYESGGGPVPLELRQMSAGSRFEVGGLTVLPLPATHVEGTLGLRVSDEEGKSFYFTSDSGPLRDETRSRLGGIHVLVTEVTMSSEHETMALEAGHLTPGLLERELVTFEQSFGRPLPRVVVVHLDAMEESDVREELAVLAERLEVRIDIGHAGLEFEV
jgi:ribonuclease BN (tRNA processing enzyme)